MSSLGAPFRQDGMAHDALLRAERRPGDPLEPYKLLAGAGLALPFVVALVVALAGNLALGFELAYRLGRAWGLLMILALAVLSTRSARDRRRAHAVELHATGLRWVDAKGERWIPFAELQSFWRDRTLERMGPSERVSSLTLRSGEVLEFSSRLLRYEALCASLGRALAPSLFPEVFTALRQGREVPLGELTVSPAGLCFARQPVIPWEEVASFELLEAPTEQGAQELLALRFSRPELPPALLSSAQVPELGLLLALLDEYAPRRARVRVQLERDQEAQEAESAAQAASKQGAKARA